ncbi:SDR family oxidoreductase [Winogradskya consettensis]|uniref:Dehydrogenase n=1 Tax=Winogradskya consettensis TaxID=113560 RepID=A0A919VUS5_9ACTN|nr:SDR family oxidoreductase [Actinoplanes consettensis]GIM79749.1 dehydrogenase [Actinoplanes consettensis]
MTTTPQTAIVTGSTSGIGAATARALAAAGVTVVVTGRDRTRGDALAGEIGGIFVPADLGGTYAGLRSFAAAARDALGGRVDILVNNAGVYPVTATADLPDAELDRMLAINVRAPHVLVAELAPAMAERGHGSIVNIGSWMSRVGVPFGAGYTASKAAIEQYTRTWAAEYGPRGVRVNTVAPGITLTPGNEYAQDAVDAQAKATPAGVPVKPEQVAAMVAFVVSDAASGINGATLDVDGGLTATRLVW